ncbi:MAG TPA: secretin N-terminal domain-containing protein [Verrucomicrobiae bacterium]|nr:secretin N-terminal domain-containing protein [Verrucomicrobiae bacterium]
MKTTTLCILAAIALYGRSFTARAQTVPAQVEPSAPATQQEQAAPSDSEQNATTAPAATQPEPATAGSPASEDNSAAAEQPASPSPSTPEDTGVGKGLFLNFHNAPIDLVLNYLSDAAGFIIEVDTPVRGKVDVWSTHPVTKDEAVDLLNSMLNKNGYAAIRNGRKLTIIGKDEAIHGDIPVKTGNDPAAIPKNDEIVTQIIPIRFVEAEQLVKDLSPMVSSHATIVANEAGNSIAVTDTQANIHHLVEIIKAIDSSAEDETELRVFHLKHHDPNEIASLLTSLFSGQSSTSGSQTPIRFGGPGGGFGGGGFGGFAARMAAAQAAANSSANGQAARIKKRQEVVAVADPRTSSVAVTASKDMMGEISQMIDQLDQESPRVPHVSVVHLENADPQEVEQVLQDMFQSSQTSRTSQNQMSPLQTRIQQNTGSTSTSTMGLGNTGLGTGRTGVGGSSF